MILRAREELLRCKNEVRRIATHLRDEAQFLCYHEALHRDANPQLSHQIAKYGRVRGRFDAHHYRQLHAISKLSAFASSTLPGQSKDTGRGGSASIQLDITALPSEHHGGGAIASQEDEELSREVEDDEAAAQEGEDLIDILTIAMDRLGADR